MQGGNTLPGSPDALGRDLAAVHQTAQGRVGFFRQIGVPLQIVAEDQNVHSGPHGQQNGLFGRSGR